MSLLFESISCLNGVLLNLERHEQRLNASRAALLGAENYLEISEIMIPIEAISGQWKCRVSYSDEIEEVKFSPYNSLNGKTFRLIESTISYPHKLEDRSNIDSLFHKKESADDIIILKDDLVTDSSYGNLLFYDGERWLTPKMPLLKGIMRAQLIASKSIHEAVISKADIKKYSSFMMINALNPFDSSRALPITNIKG